MTCPFLKETQVKYCRTAAVRKLIPLAQACSPNASGRAKEKCSSEDFTTCPVYQNQPEEQAAGAGCPFLCESLMQYCAAASVTKFVPYSESLLSRCGNPSFHYCELYLAMAHPAQPMEQVDGMAVPKRLSYSANHMWLDLTDDGVCHAGIDAFLGRALGQVERIAYVWQQGRHRPTAILTVGGVDFEVVFPNPFLLTRCNLYLRANPARLTAEPYTGGWLFEGVPDPETTGDLVPGDRAHVWMEQEQHRMNEFLQQQTDPHGHHAADGGMFAAGLPRLLDRDQTRAMFCEFFSPYASERRES